MKNATGDIIYYSGTYIKSD